MFLLASYFPYHWMLLGTFGLFTVTSSWRVVSYYADTSVGHFIAGPVFTITVLFAVCAILLIPVDIFTTANNVQVFEMEQFYIWAYGLLALSVCFFTPFAYFYAEETDAGERDCMLKSSTACKSSILVLVVFTIILGVILVIGERETSHVTAKEAATIWLTAISDENQRKTRLARAILYIVASFTAFGFVNLVFYGGFGLASLPAKLIRGHLGAEEEKLEWEFSRLKLKNEKLKLAKRATSSTRAKERLIQIERKIRVAERRMKTLDRQSRASGCYRYVYAILAPFRVGIGLGLMGTSALVVMTIGMVCVDRFFHSSCGFECGYMLNSSEKVMPNPIDMIMVGLSRFFPLDYIVFMAIGLYVFLGCAHGLARIGIRVLGIQVFKFAKGKTSSQAILLAGVILAPTALAISVTLLSIAPQYVSFGAQSYIPMDGPGSRIPCEVGGVIGEEATCRLTHFARFVGSQAANNRLFSLAFFYGQVAFVGVSVVSFLHAFCRRRDGEFALDDLSDDEDANERVTESYDVDDDEEFGGSTVGDELRMLTDAGSSSV